MTGVTNSVTIGNMTLHSTRSSNQAEQVQFYELAHRPTHPTGEDGFTLEDTAASRQARVHARLEERESPDQIRKRKRRYYLEATKACVRAKGPKVSMEEIAHACGITKPILYRHFGDRAGLVQALADQFAAEMFEQIDEALNSQLNPRDLVMATIDTYLRQLDKEPEIYQFVTQRSSSNLQGHLPSIIGNFQREVGRRVAVVMGEKMREFSMDSGGVEPLAQGIVGMVHSAGDWWVERRSMPRERLVTYIGDLIWHGIVGMASNKVQKTPGTKVEKVVNVQEQSSENTLGKTGD